MWRAREILGALLLCIVPTTAVGDVAVASDAGSFSVPVTSFKARKFIGIVRQQYDFSCGSAAVATLLTYHFERPTTEREVFRVMYEIGDKERIHREGFSLFEMHQFLTRLGYKADGFRVPLEKVVRVGVPVIVMIEVRGYRHFVVVKGLRDGWVLVGDPALGLKKWRLDKFKTVMSHDVVFAIHNAYDIGRRYFNTDGEWALLPTAPFGSAVDRGSLASFSVLLPTINEFY